MLWLIIKEFVEGIEVQYALIVFLLLFLCRISNIIMIPWWAVFSPIYIYFMFLGLVVYLAFRGHELNHTKFDR